MSKDILNQFGPNSPDKQVARATSGGQMPVKPIPYSPPTGPSNINDSQSPGLHGSNHGCCGTQGKH